MELRTILASMLLFMTGATSASVTSGYYRVKSNYNNYMTENTSSHGLTCNALYSDNYAQIWYLDVNGSSVTLKNALTQRYIQGQGTLSAAYSTGKASVNFGLTEVDGQVTFASDGIAAGLHCNGSNVIVRWYVSGSDSYYSKWTIESVSVNNEALAEAQSAYALAISSGYYRIKSILYSSRYIYENITNKELITASASTSLSAVWYVQVDADEHTATIKNVLTDDYIQTQGTTSAQYSAGSTAKVFAIGETKGSPNTYSFTDTGGRGLHCAATQSYNVVSWNSSADASIWQLEAVTEPTSEEIAAERDALEEVSNETLDYFFTTPACTELKADYKNHTDTELRTALDYMGLPATVQDMAVKVKNNSWSTYAGWDKTERTFRIADYKAYSDGDRWTGILGYQHRFGRLSNPTGIWADCGETLQVYVGTIPSGQSVMLEVAGDGASHGITYALHEGMNSLIMVSSGNCFIFYEVDNTSDGATPYTAINSYSPVTVHIEGGTVQGYFDATKGDDNTDWAAMKQYLMTKDAVCLKSSTHLMNLNRVRLVAALDTEQDVTEMLDVWKTIAEQQDHLTAREDFDTYCNNLYSVVTLSGTGNPHATTYGTNYYEGADDIFNANKLRSQLGTLWTIAHEQGHNRQNLIKLAGTTEMSNNMFSNAAIDWQGHYTARVNSIQQTFERFQQGISWLQRVANDGLDGTWECLHMYTQLYQYFHQAGYNTNFYPDLCRLLRESPMTVVAGTPQRATNDYLKFYQACCEASGLDLTDFFTAYGFFTLPERKTERTENGVNMGEYYQVIDDYYTYYIYVDQEMINEAKAAVAAKNYPKCNIIFVEDRVTAPLATYEGHAEGELRELSMQDNVTAFGQVGDVGQYTTFGNLCSSYAYNVQDGVVTMDGSGAVGFILYDNSGNIKGFYNTNTFRLPAGLTNYTIKAAAGNGTVTTATEDASIVVGEVFPSTNMWYTLKSKRGNRYVQCNGAGQNITGTTSDMGELNQWKFVLRDNERESYDIINRYDGSYLNPVAEWNSPIQTTDTRPETGWKLSPAETSGMYIISSGSAQIHQANVSPFNIINWGGGSNTTDEGCQYVIEEVEHIATQSPSTIALPELNGWNISVAETATDDLQVGQWYVMFDRGTEKGFSHGYLYNNTSTGTLYNNNTRPAGTATDNAKYLVRLIEAANDKYYIQTGLGNYFGQVTHNTNVPVIATKSQPVTIAKIDNTAGHFYVQGINGGVILDANWLQSDNNYNATVVGWNTTVPTSAGGNNDWAFYPVTLSRTYNLNAVGTKSYATYYNKMDMQTDGDTKAYYITSVENGYAQLTETANSGRDIPARTAVVLINEAAATSVILSQANGLSVAVREDDNMVKGTLRSMELDLSDATPNYSLGRKDGKIGFYKFDNNGNYTITLGANKAYLVSPTKSLVKGFRFNFGDEDGIDTIENEELKIENGQQPTANGPIYNLAGQRLSKPQKGINIINGKKVLVK